MTTERKTDSRPVIKLPFPGFYESMLSYEIDRCAEQTAENEAEKDAERFAPELRLTAPDYADILFDVTDYGAAYRHVAREYVASLDTHLSHEFGFPLRLAFETMTSPREYNFDTDRVFAFTTHKALRAMFAMSKADGHKTLAKVIAERHTSRSGFVSFYDNELSAWLAKPLRTWDHNELETLLLACLDLAGIREQLSEDMLMAMSDSGDFDTAHDNAVDWTKFEAKAAERRADKVAELKAADPDYVPPAVRCPDTIDMFRK